VISPSQRPLPTQHNIQTQETNIHALSGIQTHGPTNQAAANLRLRPRGHWATDDVAKDMVMKRHPATHLVITDDVHSFLCHAIYSSWQDNWCNITDNKLRGIKPKVCGTHLAAQYSERRYPNAFPYWTLTRLTLGYILHEEQLPVCISCNTALTVLQLLVHCPLYGNARWQFDIHGHVDDFLADDYKQVSSVLSFLI
jgi:hypothetical protein